MVGKNDKDLYGAVNVAKSPTAQKVYHNRVVELGTNKNLIAGALRIEDAVLKDHQLGVVTMVHEATHKWGGTNDHGNVDNSGKPNAVLRGLPRQKILENADSYAWFIAKCGNFGD